MTRAGVERDWLELVADLLTAPLVEPPPQVRVEERLAAQLRATFGLVATAYHFREHGRLAVQRLWPLEEDFGGRRAEVNHWGVHCAPAGHPILRYYLATQDPRPMQVLDVPERFADRRVLGNWSEVGGSWGAAAQLALPVHMGPRSHRAFVLGRADPFTAAEMCLARTVHRLLVGLDRQAITLRSRVPTTAAEVAVAAALTPRELAVLGLLADGLTAAAIARRLLIAERTVHKHLERVYAKLGAHDRLGAVLRAQRCGLLPAPGTPIRQ
jgi:DNA-binding CsgD family transcriptional regulator